MLEIKKFDTLNFEIQNDGSRVVNLVGIISEEPDNSDAFSNPTSIRYLILLLVISGILLIFGIIILLVGTTLYLIDWKDIQNNKRNYCWVGFQLYV